MTPTSSPPADVADRVLSDRVHGSLYTDPQVFDAELERIWYRTWIYVGHLSEIPAPGDRVTKSIGPEPVAMTRTSAGEVEVLHSPAGGEERLPRVDQYRGFVFGSFAAEGPSLEEHLGAAADTLDRLCRLSPEGEVELTAGWLQHKAKANWKMLLENETDGYHPQFVHASIFAVAQSHVGEMYSDRSLATARDLGNGHTEHDLRPEFRHRGEPLAWFGTTPAQLPDYVARMRAAHGEEEAERILIEGSPHVMIFPNLFVAEVQLFVLQPLAVDQTVQHVTAMQFKGAPDINRRLLQQAIGSVGPAGFLLADDSEMYERNQRGAQALRPEWLALRRGLHRERLDEEGMLAGRATDETTQRGIWKHYRELMETV